MKPTDENLSKTFGKSRNTIATWRRDNPILYKAILSYYLKLQGML
jgi:hypothetical protein